MTWRRLFREALTICASFLADATDLVTLENSDHAQIAQRLDLEHDMACALDMTLIALDPETSKEVRAEAVAALDELLAAPTVIDRLELMMYAKPLPHSADLLGALFSTEVTMAAASSFFELLYRYQTAISAVRQAWEALPDSLFGDEPTAKVTFHDAALNGGLFRLLAVSYGDQGRVSAVLLENGSISGLPNHRQVVQRWCERMRDMSRANKAEVESTYAYQYQEMPEARQRSSRKNRRLPREMVDMIRFVSGAGLWYARKYGVWSLFKWQGGAGPRD